MKKSVVIFLLFISVFSCSKDDGDPIQNCATPTNIEVSEITHSSAVLTWLSANESATYVIEYGETGFSLGSGTEVNVNGNSYTLSNLNANTSYNFYITAHCGNNNLSTTTSAQTFTTQQPPVVAEFLPNLSELNLFIGDLENLTPSPYAYNYELITPLFTDYSHKQRLIALPQGTMMQTQDDGSGLPIFPDNTVIAKTFYYNIDETNESLGKIIIETRVLIKQNGVWETGNYVWNESQTEAIYTTDGSTVNVSYTDTAGQSQTLNYEIPSGTDCFTCHSNAGEKTPIGPKLRNMNFNNQLEELISIGLLPSNTDIASIDPLPNWEDDVNFTLEERARAYFDVNCAHCHQPGGSCAEESTMDLRYETRFTDTYIFEFKDSILTRMMSNNVPNYSMPLIGTTIIHQEGLDLVIDYIDTL